MKVTTVILLAVLLAGVNASPPAQKPAPQPSSSPEKGLLEVKPAPVKTAADNSKPKDSVQSDSASPQKPGTEVDDKHPVIVNTDLITANVTVTDVYGRFVSGLNKNAFSVFDGTEKQDITFFSDEDVPVSVGILFDLTGSMSGEKVQRAKNAIKHFMDTSHEKDEYFLITLQSGSPHLIADRTRDGQAVLDTLTFVQTKGNTAFYDGVYLAAERVQRGTYSKRVVLVISDGQDNNSRYTFNDLRKALKESDVAIYAVGIEEAGFGPLVMEGSAILEEIAGVSGGKAFYPGSAAEMDDIFEQIALELRHQYAIGYRPSNFVNDGKWHKIQVKVHPPRGLPRLLVRSKQGYFAAPANK